MSYFKKYILSKKNFIIYIFILLSLKLVFGGEFLNIKKLSLFDSYFVVLDTGLYLYNLNTLDCSLIHNFNNSVYKKSNDKINLTELNEEHNLYIFCRVNEYLFIFNEYNNKTLSYKINEIDTSNNNYYYDVLPYQIKNNNISFIISFNQESSKLIFYYYNFPIKEGINEPNIITFNNMNIQNRMIKCHSYSYLPYIRCFYYIKVNNNNYLSYTTFSIDNFDINMTESYYFSINYVIKHIKIARSYNNNFFICVLNNNNIPFCYFNNYLTNEFTQTSCDYTVGGVWSSLYKVLYYNENDDFLFFSRSDLTTSIFYNFNMTVTMCRGQDIFEHQNNENYIIYFNGYQLVNFANFSNYWKCNNISILEKEDEQIYITSYTYLSENIINNSQLSHELTDVIYNLDNKDEIISYINNFINKAINASNFDDIKKILGPKGEVTIEFISTNEQKINENKNFTTIINWLIIFWIYFYNYQIIWPPTFLLKLKWKWHKNYQRLLTSLSDKFNLGNCENELKISYNISKGSNLYILKIDIEQKGKNYPIIEYEVFYPFHDDKMELLNLSICKNMYIDILIPFYISMIMKI